MGKPLGCRPVTNVAHSWCRRSASDMITPFTIIIIPARMVLLGSAAGAGAAIYGGEASGASAEGGWARAAVVRDSTARARATNGDMHASGTSPTRRSLAHLRGVQ